MITINILLKELIKSGRRGSKVRVNDTEAAGRNDAMDLAGMEIGKDKGW